MKPKINAKNGLSMKVNEKIIAEVNSDVRGSEAGKNKLSINTAKCK